MTSPILITGCARSGTSMVAGIINICGAFGGIMSGPNRNNQKGMFENHKVRQDIVKPYLRQLNVDPMGQYPLPDIDNLPIVDSWKGKVENVFVQQGYKKGPWMYKGAKMCLFWPVWDCAFPNAKWIIVRRRTPDIINSCMKTGFMRAFGNKANQRKVRAKNEHEGWFWWVHQHEERFIEMLQAGLDCKEVWPERFVEGDFSQVKKIVADIGLKWNYNKVTGFIDKKLWKARQKNKIIWHGQQQQKLLQ